MENAKNLFSESCWVRPKLDCNYNFSIDLALNKYPKNQPEKCNCEKWNLDCNYTFSKDLGKSTGKG